MPYRSRWPYWRLSIVLALLMVALPLAGCADKPDGYVNIEPAHVEHKEGKRVAHVTLTKRAVERLDLRTDKVREMSVSRSNGKKRKVIPYASLIYDPHGKTWVYVSPEPLHYIRHPVSVDYIEGDWVVLSDGPPTGVEVVTLGAAEVYGTEFEVGH